MWFSGDCNQMCTHQLTTAPLALHNPINGGNEEKEGISVREIMKIGREWTNRKEHGGFGDSWDCYFLSIIVSQ